MMTDIDISRSIIISGLPSAFLRDSTEDFADTIYELLEMTFSVTKDAVDRLIRSPRLDPSNQGFGCKCLVSFRSRVHRHRIIAQKSKVETPTVVSSITEIPRDILESSEEILEVTDEWAEDSNGIQGKEGGSSSSTTKSAQATSVNVSDPVSKSHSTNLNVDEYPDDDEEIVLVEEDNSFTTESPAIIKKELENSQVNKVRNERSDKIDAIDRRRNDVNISNGVNHNLDLPPLSPIDKHRDHHFSMLQVQWDGAPEFQWRTVNDDSEKRLLRVENIVPSDLHNPWMYSVILSASRMETHFSRLSCNEVGNFSFGKIDLYFSDDNTLISCALNYLVYLRTSVGRRIKFLLPYTKSVLKCGRSMEKRLGRLRAPTPSMCQLLVKPIPDTITEKDFVDDAFFHHTIMQIEFRRDTLGQRCAILTFASAQCAIAAHCTSNYLIFGKHKGSTAAVIYPFVAVPNWNKGDNLLTVSEMKRNDEKPLFDKEKRMDDAQEHYTVSLRGQTRSVEKKPEIEHKYKEKTPLKMKSKEMEKRNVRDHQADKRLNVNTCAGPSKKIPRTGSHSYRGPLLVPHNMHPFMERTSWRKGATNMQQLFPKRHNYAYGHSGLFNDFNRSHSYKAQESYDGIVERFAVNNNVGGGCSGIEQTTSWRRARGYQKTVSGSYQEDMVRPQPGPGAIWEERVRDQQGKSAFEEEIHQKTIGEMETQFCAQTQLADGYVGRYENRPKSAAQNYLTDTGSRASWNYRMNERVNRPW